jgi:hypothetical protein
MRQLKPKKTLSFEEYPKKRSLLIHPQTSSTVFFINKPKVDGYAFKGVISLPLLSPLSFFLSPFFFSFPFFFVTFSQNFPDPDLTFE